MNKKTYTIYLSDLSNLHLVKDMDKIHFTLRKTDSINFDIFFDIYSNGNLFVELELFNDASIEFLTSIIEHNYSIKICVNDKNDLNPIKITIKKFISIIKKLSYPDTILSYVYFDNNICEQNINQQVNKNSDKHDESDYPINDELRNMIEAMNERIINIEKLILNINEMNDNRYSEIISMLNILVDSKKDNFYLFGEDDVEK